jgi:hypothetical protein
MKDSSFTSLIILLFLFFVLPSLFKLLGQYTLGSKGLEKRPSEDKEHEPQVPGETMPGHPDIPQPPGRSTEERVRGPVSNEPIHPKWF